MLKVTEIRFRPLKKTTALYRLKSNLKNTDQRGMKTALIIAFIINLNHARAQFDKCNNFVKTLIPTNEIPPTLGLSNGSVVVENKRDFMNFDDIKEPKTYDKFELSYKKGYPDYLKYKGDKSTIVVEFSKIGNECVPSKNMNIIFDEKKFVVQDLKSCIQLYKYRTQTSKSLSFEQYVFYFKNAESDQNESSQSLIKRIDNYSSYSVLKPRVSDTFRKIFSNKDLKELYIKRDSANSEGKKVEEISSRIAELETLKDDNFNKVMSETYSIFCDKYPDDFLKTFINNEPSSKINKSLAKEKKSSAQ